jgi:hypothetical protein
MSTLTAENFKEINRCDAGERLEVDLFLDKFSA